MAWGASDPVTHAWIAHRRAREVPGAELITWDDLGHCAHVEDAGCVWTDVNAFLAQVDRAARR
ncbi:MAG TPA: alpha/beta hydrolase [Vicinamibacterales bacterium]|nr:alpha/beta hydrolase [Vicinamibacterales bacterium]